MTTSSATKAPVAAKEAFADVHVEIAFACGCGYHSRSLKDAQLHVKETRHVIGIRGEVAPTEKTRDVRLVRVWGPKGGSA